MRSDIPEIVVPIDYINDAYKKIFKIVREEIIGLIPDPILTPGIFQIKFLSISDSDSQISVTFLNGELASHLYTFSRYGYCTINIRFEIKAGEKETLANGRMTIKISDPDLKRN